MVKRTPRSLKRVSRRSQGKRVDTSDRPDVIVDFLFDDGLLFIAVQNISDRPALNVSVKFDKPIRGVHGTQVISSQSLFRKIAFLAPRKSIQTFLDTSASYFGRGEPTEITARITYEGPNNVKYSSTITHNLDIYKDIGVVQQLRTANKESNDVEQYRSNGKET